MKNIILASKSPRRRDLLDSLGLKFTVTVTDTDESIPDTAAPDEAVKLLAERKAKAVAVAVPDAVVIGADTIVYLPEDRIILGKPKDDADAKRILRMLSGKSHYVYTGVAVAEGDNCTVDAEVTEVRFRDITDFEIDDYIKTNEHADKAGAYGIQSLGGIFVDGIDGDYFNVTGMPKALTAKLLCLHGVDILKYNIKSN